MRESQVVNQVRTGQQISVPTFGADHGVRTVIGGQVAPAIMGRHSGWLPVRATVVAVRTMPNGRQALLLVIPAHESGPVVYYVAEFDPLWGMQAAVLSDPLASILAAARLFDRIGVI